MIGKTISHYTILEKLGEGGMGVVYKARDTTLDRFVAIKFLPPHLSTDDQAEKRFIHEARAASALDHSNIGTIHEIDKSGDGQTFIVMAYYEGETLRERIDRGGVGIEEALDITSQVVSGLVRAHEQGIVHRDIKPSNIIITKHGEVKIVDFGLAKLAGRTRLTKDGSMLGTVSYMSPEQARGEEVDARSDIFSVGTMLYELLSGESPFRGAHEAAILYEIVHEEPAPLSSYEVEVPAGIQHIVSRALEKNAEERYQSAEDLLKDLVALKTGSGTALTERQRGAAGERRSKTGIRRTVFLVLLAAIIAVAALVLRGRYRTTPPDGGIAVAVVDFRDPGNPDDVTRSAGITSLVHLGLVQSNTCHIISSQLLYDLRRRLFGAGRGPIEEDQALEVARESGASRLLTVQMVTVGLAPCVIWQLVDTKSGKSIDGRRVEGDDLAMLADRIITDLIPMLARECGVKEPALPPPVSTMTTESQEAFEHYMAGLLELENKDTAGAIRELERAVELDSTFALAYLELSKIYSNILGGSGQYTLTQEYAEKAWKHRARLGARDLLRLEAWREQINDRAQEAIDIYKEMLLRWPDDRELLEELLPRYIWYWRFEEAVSLARQGIALYPDTWEFYYYGANALGYLSRYREAFEVSRSYAGRHPEEARAWVAVAYRYIDMALPDSAEVAARHALDIESDSFYAQGIIADCDYYRGNIAGAIEANRIILARSDLEDGQRIFGLTHIVYFPNLPILYMELGRFEKALEPFEDARQFSSDQEDERAIALNRGSMLLRLGRPREALQSARDVASHSKSRQNRKLAAYLETGALIALDSLEAARSALTELKTDTVSFSQAHLFPNDRIRVEIELAEGNPEKALEILLEMDQRGMPRAAGLWHIGWREALGRGYLMAGRLDEAAAVHEKMLREFKGHFISHYELGKIYEKMGRTADARRQYELFLDAWAEADEGLPQLEDAKARLARL